MHFNNALFGGFCLALLYYFYFLFSPSFTLSTFLYILRRGSGQDGIKSNYHKNRPQLGYYIYIYYNDRSLVLSKVAQWGGLAALIAVARLQGF